MGETRMSRGQRVTDALADLAGGVPRADARLLSLVYAELKRIAAAHMAGEGVGHTLQPTALVHEAYLQLMGRDRDYRDRAHFFATAAAAMRSILVDHARRKRAAKRGGGKERVTLRPDLVGRGDVLEVILDVHEVLERFAQDHPRPAKVVELLFFAGLSEKEAAAVLSLSERTIKRDWRFARAWLLRAIGEE